MSSTTIAKFDPTEHPHNRYNPLTGQWVLVSPHRTKRPWSGQAEKVPEESVPEFDPTNPLCPGVVRPNGEKNPKYESTFTFLNDFPALLEEEVSVSEDSSDSLFKLEPVTGTCKVMCFHPASNVTIPTMTPEEVLNVVNQWIGETVTLGAKYDWVQVFENKGAIMGCSNPHPHCQIWASSYLPNEARVKDAYQREYFKENGRPLLHDYMVLEMKKKERKVLENSDWLVVVPWWALWPFETMILPKRHVQRFNDLKETEKVSLVDAIQRLTAKYDNLFEISFPYSMGWHGAPTGKYLKENMNHWTFHGIYYPPLLRSATVKKFMVGYELLAQAQRDLTPEQAAQRLRNLPEIHYSKTYAYHAAPPTHQD